MSAPVHDPGPEQFQQFPPNRIIVIHPGSLYVRIGRASDLLPVKQLHCIARKRRPGGKIYRDLFVPPSIPKTKELIEELEECRLQISHTLQSCMQSNGSRRYATPPQQIAAFNRRSLPDSVNDGEPWPQVECDIIVGDLVLDVDPELEYNVHFPYKRGDFNIHSEIGGSISSVLNDLYTIWSSIIEYKLGIPLMELVKYRCVLLIPDIYSRSHLKCLMSLLLKDLGFGHCFLVQESVGATFGAGIGSACVVDIGDQKTAISCVEDGISHKTTRLRMDYGAGDVCQTLSWMFHKSAFPYKNWNENTPRDVVLMRNLYQDFCHVNLDVCGPQEKSFLVDHPGDVINKYTLQVGDECIISPLSLFYTDLLKITGQKSTKIQSRQPSDPEDPFDAEFLRETGRKRETVDPIANESQQFESVNENQPTGNADEDIVVDTLDGGPGDIVSLAPGQVLGLDAAILQSIDRCSSEELKRKMYSSILIVGGGVKVHGLNLWLQNRLALQIPYAYKTEQLEIVTSPKDIDPASTVWKGAAVMSCLESAIELWINQSEWTKFGLKILRERAPFIW
ncbi:PREDICTED: actin-related protein 8 [Papilio polytes]|uniref:actin-related protein 8 n=1 Tax=Papilio polytes TaxID=76194 RepID=UPI000676325E|nr:PREDICTED: actin-related protein 8 [Papilio polytes]